jgi:hypothetical protein
MMGDRCIFFRISALEARRRGPLSHRLATWLAKLGFFFKSRAPTPDLNGICEKICDRLPIIFNLTEH